MIMCRKCKKIPEAVFMASVQEKKGFCLSCAVRKHMNRIPYCMDKISGAKDYRKISKINSNNVERGNA